MPSLLHSTWLKNSRVARGFFVFAAVAAIGVIEGCGGGSTTSFTQPQPSHSQSTRVTVLATSTGNDQLIQFFLYFDSITLTSSSGNTVTLLPGHEHDEFTHVNGKHEPLFTESVPQDTYISATATIGPSYFSCLSGNSAGTVTAATFGVGSTPDSEVTVNLPAPITVSGNTMTLSLDLLTSQSASWGGSPCQSSGSSRISVTPTFNLTTTSSQTAMNGLSGVIASVDPGGDGFTVTAADGPQPEVTGTGSTVTSRAPVWSVNATGSTVFQGIGSVAGLTAGMPIEMDAALEPDGSLAATRVAVADTETSHLSLFNGPLATVSSLEVEPGAVLDISETDAQGALGGWLGAAGFTFDNATFKVSGQMSNIDSLPFPASFNISNLVAGQSISVTSHAPGWASGASLPGLATVTLIPQTINGTVTGVSSAGGFNIYTVTLASYDLFPQLANQKNQATLLTTPGTVVVYADSNTRMKDAQPIAVGGMMRFNGLVFNDNGTLRMDCAQVNDGVAE